MIEKIPLLSQLIKFFKVAWKEIEVIKSQKIALLLIFVYPFLVIGLIGIAFSGPGAMSVKDVKVGIVNDLPVDANFDAKVSSIQGISIYSFEDVNVLKKALTKKEIAIGLYVSRPAKYSPMLVDLYYDNSSMFSSRSFLEIAKAMVQRITVDASQKELMRLWGTIADIGNNLSSEKAKISSFKDNLNSAEASINKLELDLNKINFAKIESTLNQQNGTISSMSQKNTEFKREIDSFRSSFYEMRREIKDLNDQVSLYYSDLVLLPSQIDSIDSNISLIVAELVGISSELPASDAKNRLDAQISSLGQLRTRLASWKATAEKMVYLANNLRDPNSKLNITISKADALFPRVDSESSNISAALSSSSTAISSMNNDLAVFKGSVTEVRELISDSRESKRDIESKLNASETLFSKFSTELIEFSNTDPKVLTQPVVFYEKRLFNVDEFGILVSNTVVIVLILTCMLLTAIIVLIERAQLVNLRFVLSSTWNSLLLAGKVTGQLAIAFVEALIIFVVAFMKIDLPLSILGVSSLGFGLSVNVDFVELAVAIALISIAFILLGLVVALFTKTQSTAILVILLFIVPMLFLSGMIIPIEFMGGFMQLLSSILPLTVANSLLVGLIVKGQVLSSFVFEISYLVGMSIVLIIISYFKRD